MKEIYKQMERAECVTIELYAGSAFLPNVAARTPFRSFAMFESISYPKM